MKIPKKLANEIKETIITLDATTENAADYIMKISFYLDSITETEELEKIEELEYSAYTCIEGLEFKKASTFEYSEKLREKTNELVIAVNKLIDKDKN